MKIFLLYICCLFVLLGCYNHKNEYNDIVLKIGDVSITKYEFEKNYKSFFMSNHKDTISLNRKKEWINAFIEKIYFLADAYDKGYLKDKRIERDVEHMAKYIITQPYGLYEERILFSNIKISENEIEEIYSKRMQPGYYNEEIKKSITTELISQKKAALRKIHIQEFIKKLNIETNNDVLNKFLNRLQNDKRCFNNNHIDKTLFTDMQTVTFFKYHDNSNQREISVNEFIDYFNNSILKYQLKDEKSLRSYIESMPVEELYYQNALKIGLDRDIKYKMDKHNYRNNVIYYYYEKENLANKIQIADNELLDFYQTKIHLFKDSNEVKISSFYFKTFEDAKKGRNSLQKQTDENLNNEISNLTKKHGLIDYKFDEKINNFENKKLFHLNLMINNLNDKEYSKPIELDGTYLVVKKEKTHEIKMTPFPEVKAEIKEMIYEKKLGEIKAIKLSMLKQKFDIKDNIDYTRYLYNF